MTNIGKKEKILILTIPLILISSLFLHSFVFSAPPSTPYNPGETLDPNCSPGDTNCTVYPPLPTYISTTTIVQLNNNLLSFNTGTLKILGILDVLGTTTFNGVSYRWPNNPPLANQFLQADGAGNLQWADVTLSTAGGWTDEGTIVRLQTITDSVAIGTTSAPEKLTVQGNIFGIGNLTITGTGTFQSSPLTIGNLVLSHAGLTASRIFTFPDVSDTLVSLTATQTLTNKTLGAGSTWQGNVISTQYGGTGLSFIGTANQILGVNAGGTGLEYKNITSLLTAGTGISITGTTNATIANTGILSLTAGPGISISSGQNPTITNTGVLSLNSATGTLILQGTPNQVNVNTSGNTITLSLPQDIATSSNVQFNSLRLNDSLEIVDNPTSSKTSFLMEITTYNFTTSTNQIKGIYVETKHGDFNYPLNKLVGITSNVITYSQPVTDMIAFQARGNNLAGSSNINNLIFYQSGPFLIYRNVSNYYNFLVKNPTYYSGTLSNLYGLYVEPLTVGTNRWAIYVAGDNPSYFAGQIQAKSGTLSSPSYSFIGETNTGIFRPSAGTIAFTTLGTERFRIDSSGNITGTGNLTITGTTTLATTTISRLTISELQKGSILFAGDNGLISQDNSNLFWDNTNKRLGIGTSSPQYTLDLVGTLRAGNTTLQGGSLMWWAVSNPSIYNDYAYSVAVDSTGIYVVGRSSAPGNWYLWYIEKRDIYTGALIWATTSDPSSGDDVAQSVAVDSTGIYVVGYDRIPGNAQWRIEKRNLNDGSLIWSVTSNPSSGNDVAYSVAVDSTGIYVVGVDSIPGDNQWRMEKRRKYDENKPFIDVVSNNNVLRKLDVLGTALIRGIEGNTTGLYVNELGYVGIGTNNPSNLIEVKDLIKFLGSNTFLGYQSGYSNTTGWYNLGIGYQALYSNLSGVSNIAIGYSALRSSTSSSYNIALGDSALSSNTTGQHNVGIGYQALSSNTTGQHNVGIGNSALLYNQSGSANVVMGYSAGRGAYGTSYSSSTIIGYQAGILNRGSGNILIGYQAGDNITTGNRNIIIGYDIDAPSSTASFQLNIGNIIFGTNIDGTGTTISSGNIGIGTTTPTAKLHVFGSTTLGASTSTPINFVGYVNSNIIPFSDNVYSLGAPGFRWANIYAATTTVGDLVFANQFRFTESTSSPLALYLKNQIDENILEIDEYGNLKVKGGVYAQSFNVVSTKEEKKDINEITSSTEILENIRNMKFYSYRYLKEGGSSLHIGLIAEEAPKEILGENKKSIDLYKFVSYIGIGVKAIAEKLQNITSSTIDFVNNAVSYVKELIAEKIVAKKVTVENLEVLNKIQMKDQSTGEIYCVWIENGEWKKVKGECDATSTINSQILESTSTQSTSAQENINNSSTTENASTAINNTSNNASYLDNNSNLNQNNSSNDNLLQSTEQNNIQQNDQNTNQENSTNPQ